MYDFQSVYSTHVEQFNEQATKLANKWITRPSVLGESMRYSFMNGGKRIRPVLMLSMSDALSVDKSQVFYFALALEMIHTYSLIHDDLPAMDNDEYRRGVPSCFKAFGEANAILAGDALLNEALGICLQEALKGETFARAGKYLSECAGMYGMIAGQSADLLYANDNEELDEKTLEYIYAHKTGKLLLASIMIPCILSDTHDYFAVEDFAKAFGKLFQMTDDILDEVGTFDELGKSIGKDKKENKYTCVRLYGLEGAKFRADMCATECHALLEAVHGDVQFLHDLVDYVRNRTK